MGSEREGNVGLGRAILELQPRLRVWLGWEAAFRRETLPKTKRGKLSLFAPEANSEKSESMFKTSKEEAAVNVSALPFC